jgi:hypothetical protein
MQAELQSIEIECTVPGDDDFAIENAALRQARFQGLDQFGEVAVQRLFFPALDQNLVAIAKDQCAKAIPLRLEDPVPSGRQFVHSFRQHRQDRRIHGKMHAPC